MKSLVFVFALLTTAVNAQNPGPRFSAMGSGGAAAVDIWSLQQNPAGVAGLSRPGVAVSYEQHFLDKELSSRTALFIVPFRRNALGLSLEIYGFKEYSEQSFALSYARSFGDSFRLAIGLKYYQLNIDQYGSANALSVDAGFQLKVTDKFTVASHIVNPNGGRYKNLSKSTLPVKITFGISYSLSDNILMIADVRKFLEHPMDVMTGMEFTIFEWFSLRGGMSVNPFRQYAGFGINSNKIQVDFALASHNSLGYSPQLGLSYEF